MPIRCRHRRRWTVVRGDAAGHGPEPAVRTVPGVDAFPELRRADRNPVGPGATLSLCAPVCAVAGRRIAGAPKPDSSIGTAGTQSAEDYRGAAISLDGRGTVPAVSLKAAEPDPASPESRARVPVRTRPGRAVLRGILAEHARPRNAG